MKIFIGLGDSWGHYTELEQGFKFHGVDCTFVNAFPNRVYKRSHNPGTLGELVEWLGFKRTTSQRNSAERKIWTVFQGFSLLALLLSTLPTHNVYIFSSGTSFLASYDYWLLKLFKKRIIMVFHGSDSRAPYISGVSVDDNGEFDIKKCISETKYIKDRLIKLEKYADVIINHPMSSHLHNKEIINWLSIGIPCAPSLLQKSDFRNSNEQCVIVHAPTRPVPKGSPQIENALTELKNEGYKFKYIKLVNKTNQEVLDNIAKCDFVVDELYSDLPMASFATEAASFAKPAIVGIYEYNKVKEYIHDKSMIPPVYVCHPGEVKSAIKELLDKKMYREELGRKAKDFITNKWNRNEVAKRYLSLAENNYPKEWLFDPHKVDRLYGWGLNGEKAREILKEILDNNNVDVLMLSQNKKLEQAFIDFANGK